ncbi:glycosyltransferase family 4 protein [Couchioplanes caeruleus]|uniref:Glycogen(Starch) synthase n=2 Tax=Couchioplanes caeruleus TaxID=56438 RepID=A0A1K0FWP7_9ACTN|nr:glycosyltransferase family 4 protein [Couchioplanes caeruleus]OJF09498.1 hypothetical protein BG844_37210 [Couchioplanes caeruleus subsp. caeruleus]ROP33777.1 glycogen(starch) synthase [Couchioplanes caeruleus]
MDITYLALGPRRVRAAAWHTARLAADGHRVTLAVPAGPGWDGVRLAPGVRLHPVRSRAQARRLIAAADLAYTGDPEALAAAYGTDTRTEPAADPRRRPAPADLAVVTPWYPSPDDPFAGAFVRAAAAAVRCGRISVLHTQSWYYPPGRLRGQLLGVAAERQAVRCGNVVVGDASPGFPGEVARVAAPTPAGGDYLAYGDAQTVALRAALPTGRIEAPVVHAHTGIMGGVVAARLARPDARLVVTEHATFLTRIFAQPGAHERYARMLDRADALLCVSRSLRDQLAGYFPSYAGKLHVVPNVVDFDLFAPRRPPNAPRRWLYLGRLMEHKGVLTLIDAFAAVAAEDPTLTLTLVGSGPLTAAVDARIAATGLTGRIVRRPPVDPGAVTALLHEHDLLAHASLRETFGVTVVEAVAAGLPLLVARSEGPAETLAGLEEIVGVVFAPTTDPAVIVAAYRRLRDRFADLDLPAARAALHARYGREAVAGQLLAAYAGTSDGGPSLTLPRHRVRSGSPLPEAAIRTTRRAARKVLRRIRSR